MASIRRVGALVENVGTSAWPVASAASTRPSAIVRQAGPVDVSLTSTPTTTGAPAAFNVCFKTAAWRRRTAASVDRWEPATTIRAPPSEQLTTTAARGLSRGHTSGYRTIRHPVTVTVVDVRTALPQALSPPNACAMPKRPARSRNHVRGSDQLRAC
jgi:hypothetical protein